MNNLPDQNTGEDEIRQPITQKVIYFSMGDLHKIFTDPTCPVECVAILALHKLHPGITDDEIREKYGVSSIRLKRANIFLKEKGIL